MSERGCQRYCLLRVNGTAMVPVSPGDAWPSRHTLMVICTTTGNLWDHFVKRPRQTSMYDCYGPWCGHDSAPLKG